MVNNKFVNKLVSFSQEKGFIWGPSPEIYGGLSGFYTYGPLGKMIKNNIENNLRKIFSEYDFWEVECPTVMPKKVWEASGHLGNFTDPVISCSKCKANFRVDKLIEELFPETQEQPIAKKNYLKFIEEKKVVCPSCKGEFEKNIKSHNLMMKTTVGLDTEAYNRPETATTSYLPFLRYFDFFRKKVPFGIFQIGKAYRNEISPRQFTLRMREFTQAEAQLFIFRDQKNNFSKFEFVKDEEAPFWPENAQKKGEESKKISFAEARAKGYLKNDAYAFTLAIAYKLYKSIGIKEENIRLRQHLSDEKAFYANDAWDVEVKLQSFGWEEMCGVHDRTDYDLTQHEKFSGKELGVSDETHKKEKPDVLEIAFGTDRMVFCILDNNFDPKLIKEGKTTLRIPYQVSPIQVAIFPLMKKLGMPEKAREIFNELNKDFNVVYDESGSIGRRYLRMAEAGTPYCVTVDHDTFEDKTVTIRDRDSEEQARVKIEFLEETLHKLFNNKINFKELK